MNKLQENKLRKLIQIEAKKILNESDIQHIPDKILHAFISATENAVNAYKDIGTTAEDAKVLLRSTLSRIIANIYQNK